MLDAGIESFGIFANDDQVDALITRFDTGKILDRAEVRIKIERLAQFNINAGEPFAHGRGHRAFQRNAIFFEWVHQRLG